MILSIWAIMAAFTIDIGSWMENYIGGDLYIYSSVPMRPDLAWRLEAVEGVDAVTPTRYLDVNRLKPGGVVCTWAPTPRIAATFARVFPEAVDVGGILVGRLGPLPLDVATWTARAESPEVRDYLGRHATRGVLRALRSARRLAPPPDLAVNHDLFPRDEFSTP